jgi:outer membrane receptor protein involved in Fe transport
MSSTQRRAIPAVLSILVVSFAHPVAAADIDQLTLEDLLNTKITTATKFSQRASEAPANVTVIRGDEIRSHGWRSLSQALVSVPGFEISTATDYSYLAVRGFSQPGDYNSRILLLIDGIPANDGVFDQAMIGPEFPLDMNLIDRIEVVPGPGSALYGGNAYLAVVNVITRQSDSIGRSVTVAAGSGALMAGQANAGGKDETGRHWLISASAERSDGQSRYFPQWQGVAGSDGWARGLDGENLNRLFLRYGEDDWSLSLLHGRRRKDAAGAMFGTDFSAAVPNVDATTQIGLHVRRPLNDVWAIEGQAYTGDYRWQGRYRYSGDWEIDSTRSDWLGANVQLTGNPWKTQTWVLGASARDDFRQDQQNFGGLTANSRRTLSLYVQDDIHFTEAVAVDIGGRYDRDSQNNSQFSPRGAVLIKLPAASVLKLMSGKAFRPANAFETDYSFPGSQAAGGKLKPERIITDEIALEQAIGRHGRWSASMYRNRFMDLLGTTTDFTTGIQQVRTVGGARTEGLDLGGRYRFDGGIDLRGSLSWQRCNDDDLSGAPLPNSPRRLGKLLAVVPIGSYEIGWETYYSGPRFDYFGGQVGGQTVSHLAVSGRYNRNLSWQLRATNLFDRKLATVVGPEYSLGAAGNVPTITDYDRQVQIRLTVDF